MRLAELLLEDRADFIAQSLGTKLVARLKQDTNEDAEAKAIVDQLAQADPTPTKLYLQWIAKQYISGQFKMEDLTQIKDELIEFERVKPRLANKDINSYKNLPELYAARQPFAKQEVISNNAQQAQLKDEMYKQAEVIYKGPDFTIVSPKTKEASQFFGKNTKWCTAALKDNQFDQYEDGPLYILMDKAGNKFQLHFSDKNSIQPETMDVLNQHVPLKDVLDKYPGLLNILLTKTNLSKWADPTNIDTVMWYANNVVGGRWPEAEPTIAKHAGWAVVFARDIIKGRWPEAEPYIMKHPRYACEYAKDVIKGRFPEAEPDIMKHPQYAYEYAKDVIKGRWPEAEPDIMKWPGWSYYYAKDVIRGRFPEAEPRIKQSPQFFTPYKTMLKKLGITYTEPKELK